MKIGDKLYCIKSTISMACSFVTEADDIDTDVESNTKNKIYEIMEIIDDNKIIVSTNTPKSKGLLHKRGFFLNKKIDQWCKFNDHFITIPVYRKLKLRKLNETR